MKTCTALGLMSGSSLDGLDIAAVRFSYETPLRPESLSWELLHAETIPFTPDWEQRLRDLPEADARTFCRAHAHYGHYLGQLVNGFLQRHRLAPDFIASHGHTIFHDPGDRFTVQIGDGAAMAAVTGLPVISDFRAQDVALGGQGAPIAPAADKWLLPGYDFYLNIGGIANLTCRAGDHTVAFDTGPANQVLNLLAGQLGLPYDKDGRIAASARLNPTLLAAANDNPYYALPYPKSLDNNWIRDQVFPVYTTFDCPVEDKLRTATEQTAMQVAASVRQVIADLHLDQPAYSLLATGGGALNTFLVECLRRYCSAVADIRIMVPSNDIVQFKEALLMALMGLLRIENQYNAMHTVTGARRDSINGAIHQGSQKTLG